MIYALIGTIKDDEYPRQYVNDIDGYFDGYFEDNWVDIDGWANKVLKEVDESTFIAPKIVDSPVLGNISHEWISGGSKLLIMMNIIQDVIYDGDNLGDNCWRLFLGLGKTKDIVITLSYYPMFEWLEGGEVTFINNGNVVRDFKQFNGGHLDLLGEKQEFYFDEVEWPIEINRDRFKQEELDF